MLLVTNTSFEQARFGETLNGPAVKNTRVGWRRPAPCGPPFPQQLAPLGDPVRRVDHWSSIKNLRFCQPHHDFTVRLSATLWTGAFVLSMIAVGASLHALGEGPGSGDRPDIRGDHHPPHRGSPADRLIHQHR